MSSVAENCEQERKLDHAKRHGREKLKNENPQTKILHKEYTCLQKLL